MGIFETLERRRLLAGQLFPGQQYNVGTSPQMVASGDLNADGKPDLVTASQTGAVLINLGTGDGTFFEATTYNVGARSGSPLVNDFNNDTFPDVVVQRSLGGIALMLGDGAGAIGLPAPFATAHSPTSLVAGDFNGDGNLDIAGASFVASGYITVLLGNGAGSFASPATFAAGAYLKSIISDDYNGDGTLDLAVVNSVTSGTISLFFGSGDGTFSSAGTVAVGNRPVALVSQDFNGDGRLDFAIGDSAARISVRLGNRNGTFTAVPDSVVSYSSACIVSSDFNCDGRTDLAVATNPSPNELGYAIYDKSSLWIMSGNGDGSFTASGKTLSGLYPVSLVSSDFNLDGIPDVATSNFDNQWPASAVSILLGDGTGMLSSLKHETVFLIPNEVATADLNGDGHDDLVSANLHSYGALSVLLNNGDGTLAPRVDYVTWGTGYYGCSELTLDDFDGDGNLDIIAILGMDQVATGLGLFLGNGDGTFGQVRTFAVGARVRGLVSADFNQDGNADIALTKTINLTSAAIVVSLGDGAGGFGPMLTIPVTKAYDLAVADFNGDQTIDIITANLSNTSSLAVLLGNGDGTFLPANYINLGKEVGAVIAQDFNRDGKADFAAGTGSGTANLAVAFGIGDGTFNPAMTYTATSGINALITADFNHDGQADLATQTATSAGFSVLTGSGGGGFNAPMYFLSGSLSAGIAAGDFNSDGWLDIASANSYSTEITILPNQSADDFVPPDVMSSTFDPATSRDIVLRFSEKINPSTLSASELQIVERDTGVAHSAVALTLSSGNTIAAFRMPDGLADDNYWLSLPAGAVADLAGNLLSSAFTLEGPGVFILAADANRDRKVDTADFNLLAGNFGGSSRVFSQGNFNYDAQGLVDSEDFNLFIAQYGKRLNAPAAGSGLSATPAAIFGALSSQGSDWDETLLA